jgi:hypothetical protein
MLTIDTTAMQLDALEPSKMSNNDIVGVIWSVILLHLVMKVTAPAFARKNYKHVATMGIFVFAANVISLCFFNKMAVPEALLRSVAVVLIYMTSAFIFSRLFRRFF